MNGKIYKIECNLTNDVYYGSTTQSLNKRLSQHISTPTCKCNSIIERGNFSIKLIDEINCETMEQLHELEKWYIVNNTCVNKQIPNKTDEEKQIQIDLYNMNRNEKRKKNRPELEKVKCECGIELCKQHLLRHKRTKKHLNLINIIIN